MRVNKQAAARGKSSESANILGWIVLVTPAVLPPVLLVNSRMVKAVSD